MTKAGDFLLRLAAAALAASALAGCWKEDLDDCPGANIILETIWEESSGSVDSPGPYTAVIGNYAVTLTERVNELDRIFSPGDHRLYVYNSPDKINVRGATATVASDGSGGIDNMPGFLFTYSGGITGLEAGEFRVVYAPLSRQVGSVSYEITADKSGMGVYEIIENVSSARLEGVAASMNIETGELSGASAVSPPFSRGRERYIAESRILGTVGAKQTFSLNITLPSGATQILSGDATPVLAGFNSAKTGYYHIVVDILELSQDQDGFMIREWSLNGTKIN